MKSYEEVIELLKSKGLSEDEINEKIESKIEEFSGLISKEGAAYMVAAENGIDLKEKSDNRLKIKNIIPGMKNVEIVGKVLRVSSVKEFSRNDKTGKVCSIYLGDETGTIRLTLWDDETEAADKIKVGDVIKVYGYTREGQLELRLGRYGKIIKVDEDINAVPMNETSRATIKSLSAGERKEVRAALVKVFEGKALFYRCPICGKRIVEEDGVLKCPEHGEVEPVPSLVVSGIIDDGTENIRAVFFRDAAEKMLGMSAKEVEAKMKLGKSVYDSIELGKDYIFSGRVKRNDLFNRLEFIVDDVREPNVIEEIKMLIGDENGEKE